MTISIYMICRARCMPQDPNVVATKPEASEVYIFDCSKHPAGLEEEADVDEEGHDGDAAASPEHTLKGHTEPGFAVSWSPHSRGHLLSGAMDGLICLWDIGKGSQVRHKETQKAHRNAF